MPDLAEFEVLLAIAKTGSLGAAARDIGLTQQAVSARLASIEAQTGVRLAVRTPRGSQLTPAGVIVAEWANRLLDVAHQVDTGLASLRTETRKRIKIAASQTIAEQLLPRWLVSLHAAAARRHGAAPEVILTATNSDHAIAAVRDGAADLGFIESPATPRGLRSRVVTYDELVVIVAPDHKWVCRSRSVSAAELARTPLVTRELGSGTRDSLTTALGRAGRRGDAGPASARIILRRRGARRRPRRRRTSRDEPADSGRRSGDRTPTRGQYPRVEPAPPAPGHLGRRTTPPAGAVRDLLSHITSTATPSPPPDAQDK